jgi:hypothetical protein
MRRSDPRFSSAQEFADFVSLTVEEWRAPGIVSVSSVIASAQELGTPIDSTPDPSAWDPDLVCHLGWITPLIRSVVREKGSKKTRIWLLHDASRVPQRSIADRIDKSTSTVSEWIGEVREEVEDQLRGRGYLSV